jgi:DNA-binding NtrC family response regulator
MVTAWKDVRVLVVDDDEDVLDSVHDALRLFGCDAASATNLAEARAVVAHQELDVIICDWNLDGEHSDRFLRETAQARPETALVLLTGSGREEWQPLVTEGVVQLAIIKPFDLQTLATAATRLRSCGSPRTCRCTG